MLNRSCIRCRNRKIRCDGETPCSNCRVKGLARDCRQEARKARSRRSNTSKSASLEDHEANFPSAMDAEDSEGYRHRPTLMNLAREALGDADVCTDLIREIFYWKVQSVVHASIHIEGILRQIEMIFDQVDSAPSLESDSIVLCMMVVALSLQYLPKHDIPLNLLERIKAIDSTTGPRLRQNLLFELSSSYARYQMSHREDHDSTFVQLLILFLIYDQHDENLADQIYHQAVETSFRLGLHCINTDDGALLNEVEVRTWWFLVTRSWMKSLSNIDYMISPHHFTTRLPAMERAELDIHPVLMSPGSSSSKLLYSSSWYPTTMIKLADLIRSLVEHRSTGSSDIENVSQEQFEDFIEMLPTVYQMTASSDVNVVVDKNDRVAMWIAERCAAERWLIYQLVFHTYLEFQHLEPTKHIPEACLYLAHHTIDLQGAVSDRCHVLDSFHFNNGTIIKAASIFLLYLLQRQLKSRLARSIILKKVTEAIRKCSNHASLANANANTNEFDQINGLIEMEDRIWQQLRASGDEVSSSGNHHISQQISSLSLDMPEQQPEQTIRQQEQEQMQMQIEWSNHMPSDAGVFPVFQSNSYNLEWTRLYEMFLESNET